MQRARYQPPAAPVFYCAILRIFGNFLIAVTKQPDIVMSRQRYDATDTVCFGNIWKRHS